ncbi:MAG: MetQ/NlpA family ABC transporter substrate-binding protein [Anaerolineae bacterium]|nr:MetQ/NlpA family ABC transporter substrate-binding protein [Anaerolineae bacterium]
MSHKITRFNRILTVIFLFISLSACQTPAAAVVPDAAQATADMASVVSLKIAVIPVLDALPMYVAQKEGLFKAEGLDVEFVPVASGAERDQLIASGQADGMLNEVLSTIFFDKDKTQVQVVRYARAATADSPLFRILASPKSGLTAVEQLKGVEIGVSDGTIIAYLTDRMLEKSGLSAADIKTVNIPKIPERLTLLNSGQLKAGVLPDPTSSLSIKQGAVVLVDDTIVPDLSFSTLTFRKQVIDEHPQAIRAFLAAVEQATQKINSDASRTQFVPLLAEQKLVPAPLLEDYKVPQFVRAGVPTEAQFADALAWAKTKGLVKTDVAYKDAINGSFLP